MTTATNQRLTKIVCTIGPACWEHEQLRELARTGMDIARLNVSHGNREDHQSIIETIRSLHDEGFAIPILIDTRGCEIRTGDVQDPLHIAADEEVLFAPSTLTGLETDKKVIEVGYDGFSNDVKETNRILLDNGEMTFAIVEINDDGSVLAKAQQAGEVGSRRHINLPGADIDLPSITDKDWEDIAYGAEIDVEFVALSFIRTAEEVESVRKFLDEKGSKTRIITKIETQKSLTNLDAIIAASDGIMVARGDLGSEVPYQDLPVIQDNIVRKCTLLNKPVIVATHMLESMTEHPIPTRAEVTDVAHAATEQTDATMLSGETAGGNHPPVAVEAMSNILLATETHLKESGLSTEIRINGDGEARAHAAVELAKSTDVAAIVVITHSGLTAARVSKFRPNVPIIACAETALLQRQLQLHFATYPLRIEFSDPETTVVAGLNEAASAGLLNKGDTVVVVSDTQTSAMPVASIQMRTV